MILKKGNKYKFKKGWRKGQIVKIKKVDFSFHFLNYEVIFDKRNISDKGDIFGIGITFFKSSVNPFNNSIKRLDK